MWKAFPTRAFRKVVLILICASCILIAFKMITLHDSRDGGIYRKRVGLFAKPLLPANIGKIEDAEYADVQKSVTSSSRKCFSGPKRKAVVVYGRSRVGSTFLGEFFNQHPNVYYLFEPLHGINHTGPSSLTLSVNVTRDLLNCDYDRIPQTYKKSIDDKSANCLTNVCFFKNSKFLWRNTELCGAPYPECTAKTFDVHMLSQVCRRSSLSVVKVIQLRSLGDLVPILRDGCLSLKVIQLIRDPRPAVPSQMKAHKNSKKSIATYARQLCDKYVQDWQYVKACIESTTTTAGGDPTKPCDEETKNLWKGRFIRISHEYLSEYPREAMKYIFDFVGLNSDSDVLAWLERSTNARLKGKQKFFGTVRDSRDVLKQWRMREPFTIIEDIQKLCMTAMDHYGYIRAISHEYVKNISQKLYSFDKALYLPTLEHDYP